MFITVTPPEVENCPTSKIIVSVPADQYKRKVNWQEPTATDDSEIRVLKSHEPNQSYFYVGSTYVTYTFIDSFYNVAVCQFIVKVQSTGDGKCPSLKLDSKTPIASVTY